MEIKFNDEQALRVFRILNDLWVNQEKGGLFKGVILPQDLPGVVPQDPQKLIYFLFYAAPSMRGGIISEVPFRLLNDVQQRHPGILDPYEICRKWSQKRIQRELEKSARRMLLDKASRTETLLLFPELNAKKKNGKKKKTFKIDDWSQAWKANSHLLIDYFQGDPLKIYEGATSFEEVFARIDTKNKHNGKIGLVGIRRKIFSLLTIWYQEKNFIPQFPCPIPVDFQADRVLWQTESITIIDPYLPTWKSVYPKEMKGLPSFRIKESFVNEVAWWSEKILKENNISHLHINPAIWVLGRDLCGNSFQNSASERKSDNMRLVDSARLKTDPTLWPARYQNPCFICPLEKLCTGSVSWGPHYRWGILTRAKRVPYPYTPGYPQAILPGIEPRDLIKIRFKTKRRKTPK